MIGLAVFPSSPRCIIIHRNIVKNSITCGDSHDLMDHIADASIDLIVCDGPYGVTHNVWDKIASIQEYNRDLIKQLSAKLKDEGALYLFGKPDCIDFIDYRPYLHLKSKMV